MIDNAQVNNTTQVLNLLGAYESQNVTFTEQDGSWPIVWDKAKGVFVWDVEGRRYLDLTAAFGVASAGHANAQVVKAGQQQMASLLHAMGDVHPHALKARLAQALSQITFERWTRSSKTPCNGKTIFCNSGFEAVEAALKTACLATGKPGVIAFFGAYHGLGYGALNTTHRSHFRSPFLSQLGEFGQFVPFPRTVKELDRTANAIRTAMGHCPVGAVLVEPIQARGGINVPPADFLPLIQRICHSTGTLLILDEIYTGFGRTGKWFACEHSRVTPDIICLGKALSGGFPISACVGQADIMDRAWPASTGEAIHTSTFLGHPVGCAMALAQIREITRGKLAEKSAERGRFLISQLAKIASLESDYLMEVRGKGLMVGLEIRCPNGSPATVQALAIIKRLLHEGFILLPEGEHANIISFTPPLTISEIQLMKTVNALKRAIQDICS